MGLKEYDRSPLKLCREQKIDKNKSKQTKKNIYVLFWSLEKENKNKL